MFRQLKSAVFWYYLYKFRKRVILISILLLIALFANAIYADVVQYLTLKKKLQFLEIVMIAKWVIIIFNISFSIYLLLTIFKSQKKEEKREKELIKKKVKIDDKEAESSENATSKDEKFSQREQQFLKKRKLRTKADILLEE